MMMLHAPSPVAAPALDRRGAPSWPDADEALALSLFTVWAARTGRILRDAPVSELAAEELVEFWADDQLEAPYATDCLPSREVSSQA